MKWTAADGAWHQAENWSSAPNLPGMDDNVLLQSGSLFDRRTITHSTGDTQVKSLTNHELLRLAGGTLDVEDSFSLAPNGALTVDGVGLNFIHEGPTLVDSGSLFARNGGRIELPQLQSVAPNFSGLVEFSATGPGSSVVLENLSSVTGNSANALDFRAGAGGQVLVPSVTSISGGNTRFFVDGLGSTLDFSGLTSIQNNGFLVVSNGGQFIAPALQTLDRVRLELDDTSFIGTAQISQFRNGGITVRRASPDFDGLTDFTHSSASVLDGASLTLPGVQAIAPNTSLTVSFLSQGLGSELDLSSTTSLSGNAGGGTLTLQAAQGGHLLLSGLPNTVSGGRANFDSRGFGSLIDLSPVEALQTSGNLLARQGGAIKIPNLSALDGTMLSLDDTGSLMNAANVDATAQIISQISTIRRGGLRMTGNNYDFSNISDFTNSDVVVDAGGTVRLPKITAILPNFPGERRFIAEGLGSLLDLSNVTALSGNTSGNNMLVWASNAGHVDLSQVGPAIVGGNAVFEANGLGSILDMSQVTAIQARGSLRAINGGHLQVPLLTQLDGMTLELDGQSQMEVAQIRTLINGELRVRQSAPEFSSLTNVRNSSLIAEQGGVLSLPGVTRFTPDRFATVSLFADGLGSVLDLSTITTIAGNSPGNLLSVSAQSGGVVDLSGVTRVSFGNANFYAQGPGSLLDMSSTTVISSNSQISPRNGGVIQLSESGETQIDNSQIWLEGGTLRAETIQLGRGAWIMANGTSGALDANLHNDGVLGQPGNLFPSQRSGTVNIAGDLVQSPAGKMRFHVRGKDTPGVDFDSVDVSGTATLDGSVEIVLNSFEPVYGDVFQVLTASSLVGEPAVGGLLIQNQTFLAPVVMDTSLYLVTTVAGDANLDGRSDLLDFNVLKSGFGSRGGIQSGDFNADGIKNLEDFNILKTNFGRDVGSVLPGSEGGAFAVPEPATVSLALAALVGMLWLSRRTRGAAVETRETDLCGIRHISPN